MTKTRMLPMASLLFILACFASAQAQSKQEKREEANSRAVQGTVVDPSDQPVPGAVVQLKEMRTLQVRSFITQQDGGYHFSGLKTDVDYELKAAYKDMSSGPKKLSVFDTRKEAILNFKLEQK